MEICLEANLNMNKILNDKYFKKNQSTFTLKNTKINLKFEDKKIETKLLNYSLKMKKNFLNLTNQTNFFENKYTSTLNAETDENNIEFDLLNYKKTKGNV